MRHPVPGERGGKLPSPRSNRLDPRCPPDVDPPMTSRYFVTFSTLTVVLAAAIPACSGDPAGSGGEPSGRTAAITGSNLLAAGEGILTGSNLDLLPSAISVDGHSVVTLQRRPDEVRFSMPPGRPCEVDARPVQITAGTLRHTGRLLVESALRLEPGESRILSRDQLTTLCLQLPAGSPSFVLTVLNPALTEATGADQMFTLSAWTSGGSAAAARAARPVVTVAPSSPSARLEHSEKRGYFDISSGADFYSDNPAPFDPSYATAGAGDTVRWIDFRSPLWYNDGNICRRPKDSIPTFGAVVAAVSSSGRTVIAFDERTQFRSSWTSAEMRARLTRLAEIIERWTLPAVREVLGPDYQPVAGAGGRWWHIFRTGVTQPTVDAAGLPRSMCPHYSEVAATLGPDSPLTSDQQVETVAGYLVHEYAHHAEDVAAVRRWGNVFGRGASLWSGVGESWAQTVQETAARLASRQSQDARYDALQPGSGVPFADFYATGFGERPDLSPWSDGRGPYDHGARLLMFLRETWGDAPLGSSRERFYARVMGLPTYDFTSMAALAGFGPTDALDRWSLAEATDNLVTPAAVAAHGLPQLRSWVPQDRTPVSQVSRTSDSVHPISVAHGSYAALYFFGAESGGGVSLTFAGFGSAPFLVRITRLN